jgi:hypothetical protein
MPLIKRVDEVVGWLVDGRSYLVPTIRGEWLDDHGVADWPVIGPRHKDKELGVNLSHYHIDLRFVSMDVFNRGGQNTVVNDSYEARVRYRKWTCLQACVVLSNVRTPKGMVELNKVYAGKQCAGSARTGWTCPHRGVWLGSQPAVEGVITCPGHGLRVNAKTGRLLSAYTEQL